MWKRRADLSLKNNDCTFVIKVKSRERVSHGFRQNLSTDRRIDSQGENDPGSAVAAVMMVLMKEWTQRARLTEVTSTKESNEKLGTSAQHHYPLAKYFAVAVGWCWLKHCNIYSANIFSTVLCRSHRPFATHLMLPKIELTKTRGSPSF